MKNENKTLENKWTLPGSGGGDFILGIELLFLTFLVSLLPFPESWHSIVEFGASGLLLVTAFVWAEIAADDGWIFWLCFCLGLIPYVRLWVFLCVAVCRIGIWLWDKMQEA